MGLVVLTVVLGVVVSGTVGAGSSPESRAGLLGGAPSAAGSVELLKSGKVSEPAVLTELLMVLKTVAPVSTTVVESMPGKSPGSLVVRG